MKDNINLDNISESMSQNAQTLDVELIRAQKYYDDEDINISIKDVLNYYNALLNQLSSSEESKVNCFLKQITENREIIEKYNKIVMDINKKFDDTCFLKEKCKLSGSIKQLLNLNITNESLEDNIKCMEIVLDALKRNFYVVSFLSNNSDDMSKYVDSNFFDSKFSDFFKYDTKISDIIMDCIPLKIEFPNSDIDMTCLSNFLKIAINKIDFKDHDKLNANIISIINAIENKDSTLKHDNYTCLAHFTVNSNDQNQIALKFFDKDNNADNYIFNLLVSNNKVNNLINMSLKIYLEKLSVYKIIDFRNVKYNEDNRNSILNNNSLFLTTEETKSLNIKQPFDDVNFTSRRFMLNIGGSSRKSIINKIIEEYTKYKTAEDKNKKDEKNDEKNKSLSDILVKSLYIDEKNDISIISLIAIFSFISLALSFLVSSMIIIFFSLLPLFFII